ncbi:MAG: hypothetical protein AB7F22_37860 [Reyranella sp.]
MLVNVGRGKHVVDKDPVAANIRSLKSGGRLLQEVDVTRGY